MLDVFTPKLLATLMSLFVVVVVAVDVELESSLLFVFVVGELLFLKSFLSLIE